MLESNLTWKRGAWSFAISCLVGVGLILAILQTIGARGSILTLFARFTIPVFALAFAAVGLLGASLLRLPLGTVLMFGVGFFFGEAILFGVMFFGVSPEPGSLSQFWIIPLTCFGSFGLASLIGLLPLRVAFRKKLTWAVWIGLAAAGAGLFDAILHGSVFALLPRATGLPLPDPEQSWVGFLIFALSGLIFLLLPHLFAGATLASCLGREIRTPSKDP